MSRTRVLLFVTDFRIGGTERQVVNLVAGLESSEFEPQIACFRREGQFLDELEWRSVKVAEFRIGPLWSLATLRSQRRLYRHLESERIALVHSFGLYPNLFAVPAAYVAGVRSVAAIRDTGDHLSPWRRQIQKRACSLADRIVANAFAVRRHLVEDGYHPGRIAVIHNGIALERFRAGGNQAAAVGERLGIPPGTPVVAMLARLTGSKGAEYFLQAAAEVARARSDVRFLIVGDSRCLGLGNSAYREELAALGERLGLAGRLVFTGFRTDVPELLQAVTVSVQPSLSEGLSNVVLESMAAGLPVVATRVGGNAEMVQDGLTGFLVPPRDAGALAAAIGRLLADPVLARRLGEAGRRRAVDCFSLGALVRDTTTLYREVLELEAPPPDPAPGLGPPPAEARP